MSIPAWMNGKNVVLVKTMNGFAVAEKADSPVSEALTFETWEALGYFLGSTFAAPSA